MKSKLWLLLSILLVASMLLISCAPAATPTAEAPVAETPAEEAPAEKPAGPFKVSYINADLENPAWAAVGAGFTDKAKELGMDGIAVSSSGQAQTQFKHAQDMVTQEYDAVAISGTDSSTANAAVKELNSADIPVWILHIKPDDPTAQFVAMVDAQNEGGNYDAGKYLADTYKAKGMTGTAGEITISLARSNGAARHAGFKKAMDEAGIQMPDANIKEAITYTRDEAYTFAQDLIAANPDLSIIWANYDEAVLGAMKAIEDAGKAGQILVGGFDGSPESLQAVRDGRINVMAIQPLYEHGTIVAQQMYDFLTSGKAPETISTKAPLVTTENAAADAGKYLAAVFGPTAKFPEPAAVVATEPPKVFKVSYINADLENPAWAAVGTGFTDKAEELGLDGIAVSSSGSAQTQFEHAQDMVTQEYDAVAISGTDSSTVNAAVKELNTADIPVWILHIKPDDPTAQFVAMVDAQNEGGNYDAGKYLADTYKAKGMTGTAGEITISLARSNGAARHAGFKKAMDEAGIQMPDANIKEAITYTRDEAYTFAQDLIAANPDLSIIWANYDEAVLGAMKAVEDAGKSGQILVGGFDGSPESLKAVVDGRINVMAIQPLYTHGAMVAQQMYDFLVNGKTPETISTPCPLVTTENAATEAEKYLAACFGPTATFPEE